MSGWQVGDLALCVDDKPMDARPFYAKSGKIYRVLSVVWNGAALVLDTHPQDDKSYWASRFRKIKPDTEGANEDDAAWLKDLLSKSKVQA